MRAELRARRASTRAEGYWTNAVANCASDAEQKIADRVEKLEGELRELRKLLDGAGVLGRRAAAPKKVE